MFTRRNILGLLVLAAGFTFVSSAANAKPIPGDTIKLEARMRSGVTKSKAKYEEIKNNTRRKFSFELEVGTAGQKVNVMVNGALMGTAIVNNLGRAKFELDTNLGQVVPRLASGANVVVTINGATAMNGTLR
jgi:predicted PilT family ATPase